MTNEEKRAALGQLWEQFTADVEAVLEMKCDTLVVFHKQHDEEDECMGAVLHYNGTPEVAHKLLFNGIVHIEQVIMESRVPIGTVLN